MTNEPWAQTERVWFLDHMRYVLVLIVVVFHCILSQVAFFSEAVVWDPRSLTIATCFCFFCYAFQMPLLFFLAGYFAVPSLQSKGPGRFVVSKLFRLLIPAALVLIFLNPIHRYLFHWSRDFKAGLPSMRYLEYLPQFFAGVSWLEFDSLMAWEYSILHLWFITLLFFFFVSYAFIAARLPGLSIKDGSHRAGACSTRRILAQLCVAGIAAWLAAAGVLWFFESFKWVMVGSFLTFELPSVCWHAACFALGIVAFRSRWFAKPDALGRVWAWVVPCAAVAVIVIVVDDITVVDPTWMQKYWFVLLYWVLKSVSCMLFLGAFLTAMMRYCNKTSPIHKYLSRTSYRVYLLHFSVVSCVQFAFLKMPGLSPYMTMAGSRRDGA